MLQGDALARPPERPPRHDRRAGCRSGRTRTCRARLPLPRARRRVGVAAASAGGRIGLRGAAIRRIRIGEGPVRLRVRIARRIRGRRHAAHERAPFSARHADRCEQQRGRRAGGRETRRLLEAARCRRGLRVPTPVDGALAVALLGQDLPGLQPARRADLDLCALPIRLVPGDALIAVSPLLRLRGTAGQGRDSRAEKDLLRCPEDLRVWSLGRTGAARACFLRTNL